MELRKSTLLVLFLSIIIMPSAALSVSLHPLIKTSQLCRVSPVTPLAPSAFTAESGTITNPYYPFSVGDTLVYYSYAPNGIATETISALGQEEVDGVQCLKLRDRNEMGAEVGEEKFTLFLWVTQDADDNVWLLKSYLVEPGVDIEFGSNNPFFMYSGTVQLGDQWNIAGDIAESITALGVRVDRLSTGLGPYDNCVETTMDIGGRFIYKRYYAPNVGLVLTVMNIDGEQITLELGQIRTASGGGGGGGSCFLSTFATMP